jgi:hypothetical protein
VAVEQPVEGGDAVRAAESPPRRRPGRTGRRPSCASRFGIGRATSSYLR